MTGISFHTPTEVALAYVRVFNRHDSAALRQLYSDDFVAQNPRWPDVKHVDEVYEAVTTVWAKLNRARFELYNLIAQGPVVVLELRFVWSDDRAVEGEQPRLIDREFPVTDVFKVVDGKLAALRAYQDTVPITAWLAEADRVRSGHP
jgi:limonene-1,2-epoxide hydrolase